MQPSDVLNDLPMRATTLQQNVLVASLSPALQLRVWAWVGSRCMPRNPELVRAYVSPLTVPEWTRKNLP